MSEIQPPTDPDHTQATSLVEVVPILQAMHHKETIPCYTLLPDAKGAQVVKPKIELTRGAQVFVDGKVQAVVGAQTYLRVVQCEQKPEAAGKYLRQEEVIPVTESALPQQAQALGKLNLRRVKRANKAGKPIMETAGVQVPQGAVLWVSRVHRVTSADRGDGVIDADGKKNYRLVVRCEQVSAATGLFVQAEAIELL